LLVRLWQSMSRNDRKRIANQIDGLIRQKRISEDQLLHLMWLFAQEENVKITRNMSRRLLRLEKYSEETIKKVTKFLSQVKACPRVSPEIKADSARNLPSPQAELTTEYDATSDNQLELLREQDMKRRKVRKLQDRASSGRNGGRLPQILPMEIEERDEKSRSGVHLVDADILQGWLLRQTKQCKAAKKQGPGIAAPYGRATALPVSVRVISKKKKKRRARKSSNSRTSAKKPMRAASTAPNRSKRRAVGEMEDEDSGSVSSSEIIEELQVEKDIVQESEGGVYDCSEGEGSEEEEEDLLVDEEAEEEEDDEDESLGEDVIEGEQLSDDLEMRGSIYLESSSE